MEQQQQQRLLDYLLKETAVGVRMMVRDKSTTHFFDAGTDGEGKKHVFFMAILPEEVTKKLEAAMGSTVPSDPFKDNYPAE
jgi:hypothetical protein